MSKYTVGRIITGGYRAMSYPRALLLDGKQVATVDSNEGPALLGDMTEQDVRRRWPEVFREVSQETGRTIR